MPIDWSKLKLLPVIREPENTTRITGEIKITAFIHVTPEGRSAFLKNGWGKEEIANELKHAIHQEIFGEALEVFQKLVGKMLRDWPSCTPFPSDLVHDLSRKLKG